MTGTRSVLVTDLRVGDVVVHGEGGTTTVLTIPEDVGNPHGRWQFQGEFRPTRGKPRVETVAVQPTFHVDVMVTPEKGA